MRSQLNYQAMAVKVADDSATTSIPNVVRESEEPPQDKAQNLGLALYKNPDVSKSFLRKIEAVLRKIPRHLRKLVAEGGCTVILVNSLSDLDPTIIREHAKRHPDLQRGYLPAFYDREANALVFIEKADFDAWQQLKSESYLDQSRVAYAKLEDLTFHEFGHAIDFTIVKSPLREQFDSEFGRIVSEMPISTKPSYGNFLEKSLQAASIKYLIPNPSVSNKDKEFEAARRETFAELFASAYGHGTIRLGVDRELLKRYLKLVELIKTLD